VRETAEELQWLQALMDATHARANAHMAAIVKPERQLSAAQVVAYLQGLKHVGFGTVNGRGEPRVSRSTGTSSTAASRSAPDADRHAGGTSNATRPAAPRTMLATKWRW
jgi:hypothetical protein